MADESDVVSYEIWRGMWYDTTANNSAYPEYDDLDTTSLRRAPAAEPRLWRATSGCWLEP